MLKLKEIRQSQKISIVKLSEMTGLHRRTLEGIEKRGDCLVSNLSKIAKALCVTLNDIYTEDIIE